MTPPVSIADNWQKAFSLTEEQWNDLSLIAGRTVKNLCDRDDGDMPLLVFPDSLNHYGDKIGKSTIIDIQDDVITTGNLMGFVGCRQTRLRIHSRFDKEEKDYFMHYMLERVFSVTLFDLRHSTDPESVFDFALFLFPHFLNRALAQGLYREYVTREQNDSRVRGAIDIPRHIRLNFPFYGNVAYKTREHTADNDMTELVRHTIEYIRTNKFGSGILSRDEETKGNVSSIIEATGSYEKRKRSRVINRNLRSKIHPYYSDYEPLRRLCIQILRQEELKYGKDDDTVYGVLFDGAWLWEEYLAILLADLKFEHPRNNLGEDPIYLFTPERGRRFPDFYDKTIVLDAKYKRYEGAQLTDISREDLAQVISYMYVLKRPKGGFLVPDGEVVRIKQETLNGYGGNMFLVNLPIPSDASTYDDFCERMHSSEATFIDAIKGL